MRMGTPCASPLPLGMLLKSGSDELPCLAACMCTETVFHLLHVETSRIMQALPMMDTCTAPYPEYP